MHKQSVESFNTYSVVGLSILTLLASESKYHLIHVIDTYQCPAFTDVQCISIE